MDFELLINQLASTQIPFIPKHPPIEMNHSVAPHQDPLCLTLHDHQNDWWRHSKIFDQISTDQLEVIENTKVYSLYTSFLSLVSHQYNLSCTYQQKQAYVEGLITYLCAKLNDPIIQSQVALETSVLIDEIKNSTCSISSNVIIYIASVFDLNIIVIPLGDSSQFHPELYYHEASYDMCKPHIMLGRDMEGIYHAIMYSGQSLINYHEHAIIKKLIDGDGILHPTYKNKKIDS